MRNSDDPHAPRRRRLGRRAAEDLLDGRGPADGALERLLQAAAAPALPAELAGERDARITYSEARRSREANPQEEKRVLSKALLTKALVVKICATAVGVSVVSTAAAAEAGVLPSGVQKAAHSAFGAVGVPAPSSAKAGVDVHVSGQSVGDGQTTPGSIATSASASAKPGVSGSKPDQDKKDAIGAALLGLDAPRLCRAAVAGDRDDHGKDLTPAELQKLAQAAGLPADQIALLKSKLDAQRGAAQQQIEAFCGRLAAALAELRDGKLPPFPIPSGLPGVWPTSWPTSLPTGLPTALPTQLPTGRPTGLPSGLPSLPGISVPPLPSGVPGPGHPSGGGH